MTYVLSVRALLTTNGGHLSCRRRRQALFTASAELGPYTVASDQFLVIHHDYTDISYICSHTRYSCTQRTLILTTIYPLLRGGNSPFQMALFMTRLSQAARHNLHTLRTRPLAEISGSLGSLCIFIPHFTTMAANQFIHLSSTLILTGLSNILVGVFFGIPMPVQPMMVIASVSMKSQYGNLEETMYPALGVAIYLMLLSMTGFMRWLNRIIPVPVVKGVQVSTGLWVILFAGEQLLRPLHWYTYFPATSSVDNMYWALAAFLVLLACERAPRVPYALIVVIFGLILATGNTPLYEPPWRSRPPLSGTPPIVVPSVYYLDHALLGDGLGELARTILTSIIATSHLAKDLPIDSDMPTPTATELSVSVAAINILGCWFGAMPANLGVQGLAAQYRFGARSGASVMILGGASLILGLVALFSGLDVSYLLACIPKAFLGVMAVATGVELLKTGETLNTSARDLRGEEAGGDDAAGGSVHLREVDEEERRARWAVMLVTVAGSLTFKSETAGFIVGMLWYWGLGSKEQTCAPPQWWTRGAASQGETRPLLDPEVPRDEEG
ncbi:hypothetical protein PENSPDRAFT_645660 [Peniophora sp. CONT]|nr:hypothetical protein PENSPDRAFT_645660 [Peniophora sp. CONT]